ncbi:MAG: hypothetical protein SGPRY_003200 [Prymnesium sp.]
MQAQRVGGGLRVVGGGLRVEEVTHFAAVCEPLHWYIQSKYPALSAEREETTKADEARWGAESPRLRLIPHAGTAASFACVGCGELALPPAVLTCGHVVLASREWASCPLTGCVGKGKPKLAVCGLISSILTHELSPAELEAEGSRGCCAPAPSAAEQSVEQPSLDGSAMVGSFVELHSLVSEAGGELNGLRGTVRAYNEAAGRLVVKLSSGGREAQNSTMPARGLTMPCPQTS